MGFIRDILIRIDSIVYGILEQIFQLIINLANFDLFTGDVLKEFSTKIYLILGLVMVFKLILSFIQILIDPDKIDDKESGVVNILKRVVISMILIVLVPSIFSFAKQVQNLVIPIIPKVVLGVPIDVDDSQISYDETITDPIAKFENEQGNVMISSGKLMAYYSFLPFFYYNSGCDGLGGNEMLGTLFGTTPADKSMNVKIYSVLDAVPHVNDKSRCSTTSDGYDYNYRYIISTLVGAYLVYVLVTVALKIAIRAIKFGICELIAPIPIASYIDPKSSKKAFDNWVSTSVKVYLDLFVRLIVVYFVVYIFKILFDGEKFIETLGKYGPFQGLLVALFIITGLINFAKEMPKFVSDMLGVPDGFSDIGDMFKGQGWRALGTTIGGAAGLAAQPISSAITNYRTSRKMGEGKATALRRAFNTGIGGVFRSGRAFVNNEGFAGAYTKAHQTSLSNTIRRVNIAKDKRREREEKVDKKFANQMLKERYKTLFNEDFDSDYKNYENNHKILKNTKREVDEYTNRLQILQKQRDRYDSQNNQAMVKLVDEQMKLINQRRSNAIRKSSDAQVAIHDFETKRLNPLETSLGSVDYKEYMNSYTKDIQHAPGTISGAMSGAFNTFIGNPVPTSSDYQTGKSLMDEGNGIFKSFAATIDEEPSKVIGNDYDMSATVRGLTYSQFLTHYQEAMTNGSVTIGTETFSKAQLIELHKRNQKKATIKFANDIANGVVVDQKRKDMLDEYTVKVGRQLNLGQSDMRTVESEMQTNIGKFLADTDDKAKNFSKIATEMAGREQLKQESKNGGH